ncbi:hypothetical protein KKH43_02575 [Patescibacteria group bacterium]|nr:hypothetical protein [Patescibacteria group bacterium]
MRYVPKLAFRFCINRGIPLYVFFDPGRIKNEWYEAIKKTQIHSNLPLFLDRQSEIKDSFSKSTADLLKHYVKFGFPNSERFKENYLKAFYGNTKPGELKKAYDSIDFDYTD